MGVAVNHRRAVLVLQVATRRAAGQPAAVRRRRAHDHRDAERLRRCRHPAVALRAAVVVHVPSVAARDAVAVRLGLRGRLGVVCAPGSSRVRQCRCPDQRCQAQRPVEDGRWTSGGLPVGGRRGVGGGRAVAAVGGDDHEHRDPAGDPAVEVRGGGRSSAGMDDGALGGRGRSNTAGVGAAGSARHAGVRGRAGGVLDRGGVEAEGGVLASPLVESLARAANLSRSDGQALDHEQGRTHSAAGGGAGAVVVCVPLQRILGVSEAKVAEQEEASCAL
ncbi:hypothetical protein ON010_g894 [Phytophthora cinnamomi]|nr:hypothetical protein ON010_g894 [Phytophthora cinnamomi]